MAFRIPFLSIECLSHHSRSHKVLDISLLKKIQGKVYPSQIQKCGQK